MVVSRAAAAMARQVEEFDWTTTPLGAVTSWPVELRTLVRFILESAFPAAIVWGPSYTTIYNDAFRPLLKAKPEALGRSFADVWSESGTRSGRSPSEPMRARRPSFATII